MNGLKSYKYQGVSPSSNRYNQWYDRKSCGETDAEAWNEVFEKQMEMRNGGKVSKKPSAPARKAEVGDILKASTGVEVIVVEYDKAFGGRVKVIRIDGMGDKVSPWKPLKNFK